MSGTEKNTMVPNEAKNVKGIETDDDTDKDYSKCDTDLEMKNSKEDTIITEGTQNLDIERSIRLTKIYGNIERRKKRNCKLIVISASALIIMISLAFVSIYYPSNRNRFGKFTTETIMIDVTSEKTTPEIDGTTQKINKTTEKDNKTDAEINTMWDRLPSFIIPQHYDLFLNPDLTTLSFFGNVMISFSVTENTKFIVLHSVDLSVDVNTSITENIIITSKPYNERNGQWNFTMNKKLEPNQNYNLKLNFSGKLTNHSEGFYVHPYKTSEQKIRYVALSQFKPIGARKAFPCFDEPSMKATFQLTIRHWKNHTAYSNTNVQTVGEQSSEWSTTMFEKTPEMSTYHIGFVIGNFTSDEETINNVTYRVWFPAEHPENNISISKFVIHTTEEILETFNILFKTEHGLRKLDLIAIPSFYNDISENLGLLIFNPNVLESYVTDSYTTQMIIQRIAHKIVHQWFGNVVTPQWWTEKWIDEGLAIYFEYILVDMLQPEWKMMDQFVGIVMRTAFNLNILTYANSISEEFTENIDPTFITKPTLYSNAACIIRMFENILSKETIYNGLQNYLKKYQYKNVNFTNLWDNLMEAVIPSKKVEFYKKMMRTWIYQKNYPIINATYNIRSNFVKLTQTHFEAFPIGPLEVVSSSKHWFIPITYRTDAMKSSETYLLSETDGEIYLNNSISWIKLNAKAVGFYRVMYSEELWNGLLQQIQANHNVLPISDRSNLLDDAFALASVNILNVKFSMNLSKYLKNETEYTPWSTALYHFKDMYKKITESRTKNDPLAKFILGLMNSQLGSLEKNGTNSHLNGLLLRELRMAQIFFSTSNGENNETTDYKKLLKKNESLPPSLQAYTYDSGVKFGGENFWKYCMDIHKNTTSPSKARLLLHAMAKTENHDQFKTYLDYIWNSSKVPAEDLISSLWTLTEYSNFTEDIWKFLKNNFHTFLKMCENSHNMDTILREALSNFNKKSQYESAKKLISKIEPESRKKKFDQTVEKIYFNILWIKKVKNSVVQWLKENTV